VQVHGRGEEVTPPPITDGYRHNFETLLKASRNDDLCLVSAIRAKDQAPVALVCAHFVDEGGMHQIVPIAQMIEGNPYELYEDPTA